MNNTLQTYKGKTLSSVPQGYVPFLLAEFIENGTNDILYIAGSGAELEEVANVVHFIAPEAEVLKFPAWDTVPYDRVSPSAGIMGERVETLIKLAFEPNGKKKRLIVASVGSAIQKLPPKKIFLNAQRVFKKGGVFLFNDFLHYASINGYQRVEQVMEPAEYAVRGDIIDIFPSSAAEPIRIDLFDDTIEKIRVFDPVTQRTVREIESYEIGLAGEVVLDSNTVENFRNAYREAFGAAGLRDELYESISNGVKYIGYENWLPFFYDEPLLTLFDYLPSADVILGANVPVALGAKTESIRDYYTARLEALNNLTADETVYRPIKPEGLYLTQEDFDAMMRAKKAIFLSDLSTPNDEKTQNLEVVPARDFSYTLKVSLENVYQNLKDYSTWLSAARSTTCARPRSVPTSWKA